ncbi:regulatory protein luxO, partial [Vibrio parahaemolyticus V-223/04]
ATCLMKRAKTLSAFLKK